MIQYNKNFENSRNDGLAEQPKRPWPERQTYRQFWRTDREHNTVFEQTTPPPCVTCCPRASLLRSFNRNKRVHAAAEEVLVRPWNVGKLHVTPTSWHRHVWNAHTWSCSRSSEWEGNTFSCRMENLTPSPHHDPRSPKCQQPEEKTRKSHPFCSFTWKHDARKGTRGTKFSSLLCDCHSGFVFL